MIRRRHNMSYMNDDTDPFGIPYSRTICSKKEIKEYSFEDLKELHKEQRKLEQELRNIKGDKNQAMEYLREKLEKYVDDFAKVKLEDEPYLKCNIITEKFDLNQLEKIKEDFNLKNIKVELGHVMGEPKKKIIISLEW